MTMRDETMEQFADLLQNIEFSILATYEDERDLLDLDVIDALDALIRTYAAEEQGRNRPVHQLSGRTTRVFSGAEHMCEWRLGRRMLNDDEPDSGIPPEEGNSVAEILICLKQIRKSVRLWNEQAGRQGYLDYVSDFFRRMKVR
jgi:hypothetical protein